MGSKRKKYKRRGRIKIEKDSWIAGGLLLAFVIFLFLISVRSVNKSIRIISVRSWVETPCTLSKATLRADRRRMSSRRGSRHRTYYVPAVEYQFSFEGRRYSGNEYMVKNSGYRSKTIGERVVANLKTSRNEHCYVNPADPNESVLRLNSKFNVLHSLWPLALFGIVTTLFASFTSQKLRLED